MIIYILYDYIYIYMQPHMIMYTYTTDCITSNFNQIWRLLSHWFWNWMTNYKPMTNQPFNIVQ